MNKYELVLKEQKRDAYPVTQKFAKELEPHLHKLSDHQVDRMLEYVGESEHQGEHVEPEHVLHYELNLAGYSTGCTCVKAGQEGPNDDYRLFVRERWGV